jgi:hypothetical protein
MKTQAKVLYEKMADYKRFATILLAIGVFFYLGVILPTEKNTMDVNIMIVTSTSFIAASILFFIQSKHCSAKLTDLENGQNQ